MAKKAPENIEIEGKGNKQNSFLGEFSSNNNNDIKNIFNNSGGDISKNESIENQGEIFCGIIIEELTEDQKLFYNKLNLEERKEFSKIVTFNKADQSLEFLNTIQGPFALSAEDDDMNVTQSQAEGIARDKGNGWKLPTDIGSWEDDKEQYSLNPKTSDYDAMIDQMPGSNDEEKVENFILFTGMSGCYKTGTGYTNFHFIVRTFIKGELFDRLIGENGCYDNVRLVKSLQEK